MDYITKEPTFKGYLSVESIINFLHEIELHIATRRIPLAEQVNLFRVSLGGPARRAFDRRFPDDTDGADDNDHVGRLAARKQWLRDTFHTEVQQRALRDKLNQIEMKGHEDPHGFYTRICHHIMDAGYPDEVQDIVAETCFSMEYRQL